jgi:nitroreductase
MNSFIEIAQNRFSCRSFTSKQPSKQEIEQVLEAARIAPSATNAQPWKFIVITQPPLKDEVISCYSRDWLSSAPVIIVACGDHNASWRRADGKDHCDIDLAIAIDHLTLMATSLGMATCWICKFNAMRCSELLKLPSNLSPIALIPLGYPTEQPKEGANHFRRKDFNEIVFWEGLF